MGSGLPTIGDVARQAGVSPQTVSNVLNNPHRVSPATRDRVQAVVDELNYRPNSAARQLRTRASSTIGVRIDPASTDGVSGAALDRFLHELTQRAEDRGLRVLLFTAVSPEDEIAQYTKLRDTADVDAIVVTGTFFGDPRPGWLRAQGLPFVAFGRPWGADPEDPLMRWVDVDGREGVRQATTHLYGRGLRAIGFLGWPRGSGTGDDRRLGWLDACADLGIEPSIELAAEERVPDARAAVQQLLSGGSPVEAIVCVSDTLALGALMAVREAGLPHFPVIGFDNTPVARAVGLSSVDQSLDAVAQGVLDLLLGDGSRIRPASAETEPHHRLVAPHLVVRRSSHLAVVDTTKNGKPPFRRHAGKETP